MKLFLLIFYIPEPFTRESSPLQNYFYLIKAAFNRAAFLFGNVFIKPKNENTGLTPQRIRPAVKIFKPDCSLFNAVLFPVSVHFVKIFLAFNYAAFNSLNYVNHIYNRINPYAKLAVSFLNG